MRSVDSSANKDWLDHEYQNYVFCIPIVAKIWRRPDKVG
jgi:hypothetical protein